MMSTSENINLRKPSKEEIDKITVDMIAQVQSNYGLRNRVINDKTDVYARIFIKDTVPKMQKAMKELEPLVVKIKDQKRKKWEAKKDVTVKRVGKEEESHPIQAITPKVGKVTEDSSLQTSINKGTNLVLQLAALVDMFFMLSQMTIKVPLSKMFRFEEHINKALEWINGVGQYTNVA